MKAINSNNQKSVDKAIKQLKRYNLNNTYRDECEGNSVHAAAEDDREYRRLDRQCQMYFDMFLTAMNELPQREQKQIYKSDLY
jgi:hypothetical protein